MILPYMTAESTLLPVRAGEDGGEPMERGTSHAIAEPSCHRRCPAGSPSVTPSRAGSSRTDRARMRRTNPSAEEGFRSPVRQNHGMARPRTPCLASVPAHVGVRISG